MASRKCARVTAVFNQAGGVGKSSVTVNLGYALSRRKRRVLLIDLDPQASLSMFLGGETQDPGETALGVLSRSGATLPHPLAVHGMDLIPSAYELAMIEFEPAGVDPDALRHAIAAVADRYDHILVDCPPSLATLSYVALRSAARVLVPVQCQYKALRGTDLLLHTLDRIRTQAPPGPSIAAFVPTMYDARNAQDRMSLEALRQRLSDLAPVTTPIPRATAVADAAAAHEPLAVYSPKHPILAVFDSIAHLLEKP